MKLLREISTPPNISLERPWSSLVEVDLQLFRSNKHVWNIGGSGVAQLV